MIVSFRHLLFIALVVLALPFMMFNGRQTVRYVYWSYIFNWQEAFKNDMAASFQRAYVDDNFSYIRIPPVPHPDFFDWKKVCVFGGDKANTSEFKYRDSFIAWLDKMRFDDNSKFEFIYLDSDDTVVHSFKVSEFRDEARQTVQVSLKEKGGCYAASNVGFILVHKDDKRARTYLIGSVTL